MAKQLALHQGVGNRAAVHGHERAGAPTAAGMDGPRDEFLARSGLARHQHVHGAGGDPVDDGIDLPHGGAFAQKIVERVGSLDRAAKHFFGRLAPRFRQQPHQRILEFRLGPGDVEIIPRAGLEAGTCRVDVRPRIDHHHRQLRVGVLQRGMEPLGRGPGTCRDDTQIPGVAGERADRRIERLLHPHFERLKAGAQFGVGQTGAALGIDDQDAGLLHGMAQAGGAGDGRHDVETFRRGVGRLPAAAKRRRESQSMQRRRTGGNSPQWSVGGTLPNTHKNQLPGDHPSDAHRPLFALPGRHRQEDQVLLLRTRGRPGTARPSYRGTAIRCGPGGGGQTDAASSRAGLSDGPPHPAAAGHQAISRGRSWERGVSGDLSRQPCGAGTGCGDRGHRGTDAGVDGAIRPGPRPCPHPGPRDRRRGIAAGPRADGPDACPGCRADWTSWLRSGHRRMDDRRIGRHRGRAAALGVDRRIRRRAAGTPHQGVVRAGPGRFSLSLRVRSGAEGCRRVAALQGAGRIPQPEAGRGREPRAFHQHGDPLRNARPTIRGVGGLADRRQAPSRHS